MQTPPFPYRVLAALRRWHDYRTEQPTYLQQLHAVWTAPTVRPAAPLMFRNLSVVRSQPPHWWTRVWRATQPAQPSKSLRKIA